MKLSIQLFFLIVVTILSSVTPLAQAQLYSLIGRQAPDFTLKNLDGKELSMSQYRDGKAAIIFFWATWCPHCRSALKDLSEKKADIEAKGMKIILVDLGEEADTVRQHLQRNKIEFNVFLDMENSLSDTYEVIGVPTFVLVNGDGIVKFVDHGLPEDFEKILQ